MKSSEISPDTYLSPTKVDQGNRKKQVNYCQLKAEMKQLLKVLVTQGFQSAVPFHAVFLLPSLSACDSCHCTYKP